LIVVATLGVLAMLAVVDAFRSSPHSSARATGQPTSTSRRAPTLTALPSFSGSREVAIEEIGNTWAQLYAAGSGDVCVFMAPPLCGIKPLPAFRASFEGATVQDIAFKNDHDAAAMFSNGVVVEFRGDRGTWTIVHVFATARHFFE
jgi:hypothetical protein